MYSERSLHHPVYIGVVARIILRKENEGGGGSVAKGEREKREENAHFAIDYVVVDDSNVLIQKDLLSEIVVEIRFVNIFFRIPHLNTPYFFQPHAAWHRLTFRYAVPPPPELSIDKLKFTHVLPPPPPSRCSSTRTRLTGSRTRSQMRIMK